MKVVPMCNVRQKVEVVDVVTVDVHAIFSDQEHQICHKLCTTKLQLEFDFCTPQFKFLL